MTAMVVDYGNAFRVEDHAIGSFGAWYLTSLAARRGWELGERDAPGQEYDTTMSSVPYEPLRPDEKETLRQQLARPITTFHGPVPARVRQSILAAERASSYEAGYRAARVRHGEIEEARLYEAEQEGYARGWRHGFRTAGAVAVVIFFILTVLF